MPALGTLEDYFKRKNITANSEVREACVAGRTYLTLRLSAHSSGLIDSWRRQFQKQAIEVWLIKNMGKTEDDQIRSKLSQLIILMNKVIQNALNALEPVIPPAPPDIKYAKLVEEGKVVIKDGAINAVDRLSTTPRKNYETKICGIYARGNDYHGHGPTSALGKGVIHCHIGNGDGVGFKWIEHIQTKEDILEIWGHGFKDDTAKKGQGNSGYKWN